MAQQSKQKEHITIERAARIIIELPDGGCIYLNVAESMKEVTFNYSEGAIAIHPHTSNDVSITF